MRPRAPPPLPRARLLALILALILAPARASARGWRPSAANAFGFLVPEPPGGRGCGRLNYANCFPRATATARRWSATLDAAYDARSGTTTTRAGAEKDDDDVDDDDDAPRVVKALHGDVFADASAALVPDVDEYLYSLDALSDAARSIADDVVRGLAREAEAKAAAAALAATAARDAARATLLGGHER